MHLYEYRVTFISKYEELKNQSMKTGKLWFIYARRSEIYRLIFSSENKGWYLVVLVMPVINTCRYNYSL